MTWFERYDGVVRSSSSTVVFVMRALRLMAPPLEASKMILTTGTVGVLDDFSTHPIGIANTPDPGLRHSSGSSGPKTNVVPSATCSANCARTSEANTVELS